MLKKKIRNSIKKMIKLNTYSSGNRLTIVGSNGIVSRLNGTKSSHGT
jgi:hypothetical protein